MSAVRRLRADSRCTYRIRGRPPPFAKHAELYIMVVATISASRKSLVTCAGVVAQGSVLLMMSVVAEVLGKKGQQVQIRQCRETRVGLAMKKPRMLHAQ